MADRTLELFDRANNRSVVKLLDYKDKGYGLFSTGGAPLDGTAPPDDQFQVMTEDVTGSFDLISYKNSLARIQTFDPDPDGQQP